jgi:hypothetical protein
VYLYLDITVTSPVSEVPGQGGSRVYTLTILGYQPSAAKWTAAVTNVPASFTVTAVTMSDNGSPATAIAMEDKGDGNYEKDTALTYDGKTFVVSMTDGDNTPYSTQALSPTISGALGGNRSVTLDLTPGDGTGYGRTISTATELYNLTLTENADKDWSVIADIVLPDGAWTGPTNFSGHFYGNGHTITLPLYSGGATVTGNWSLFSSISGGAEISGLMVNISTPEALKTSGNVHIGGIVGDVYDKTSTTPIVLKNLTVRGTIELGARPTGAGLVVGGLVGAMNINTTPASIAVLQITNCVSEVVITANFGNGTETTINMIGGIVGRADKGLTISDSYFTGSITINKGSGTNQICVGGIAGTQGITGSVVKIENCYATGALAVNRSSTTAVSAVGGIIGYTLLAATQIKSCVALNPSVTGNGADVNRIVGFTSVPPVLVGNIALDTMAVYRTSVLSPVTGTATDLNGLATTEIDLRKVATWAADLGYDTDVWDFSGLAAGWPVLK